MKHRSRERERQSQDRKSFRKYIWQFKETQVRLERFNACEVQGTNKLTVDTKYQGSYGAARNTNSPAFNSNKMQWFKL